MDFSTSTQRQRWIFAPERLEELRAEVHDRCVRATKEVLSQEDPSFNEASFNPLTLDEAAQLR
jgi:hypothetical protein